ncbi:MAG: hypothetical protein OEV44_01100 [Spirochaetota bacterium]|nr:hypothetical protein [Spirochaetota bacterium]
MTQLIEDFIPVVKYSGLNTAKDVALSGTNTFSGATTLSGATTATGSTITPNPVLNQTITDIDAQNATPTIAQIRGGVIVHTSATGAGTATVPTGTAMSAGVTGVAVGSTIKWLYHNDGNQTVTITAATDHTLVGGTAAVTTGKHMMITSINTAANTWVSYLETLM